MKLLRKSRLIFGSLILLLLVHPAVYADKSEGQDVIISEVSQSLLQMRLKKGVTSENAVKAMVSKAASLKLKLVARHQISKELNARGIKTPLLEMFQFCNIENAGELVAKSRVYAAYLPCQISMTADEKGDTWLLMRNMDMMIDNEMIPPELAEVAIRINQAMLAVITAGATGTY